MERTIFRIPNKLDNYSSLRELRYSSLFACKLILSRCSMYAPRRLVVDLPLLSVVADLDKILVSTSPSELETRVEKILNSRRRGKAATIPIRRINAMIYEDDAMLNALRTGDAAEPSLSSRTS